MENISGRAILIAWLGGATAFLLVMLILSPLVLGIDATLTLRYFASLVLGDGVLVEATSTTLLVGTVVHYAISFLFTLLIVFVVHRWGLWVGILGGAGLGLAIYSINLYTMTMFFPWFFAINSIVLLIAHVAYGALVGGIYETFDYYDEPIKFKEVA